jgi:predicted extracellular nuclease
MRTLFLFLMAACLPLLSQAQYPLLTIEQIQRPSQDSLAACNDRSPYLDDTVRVQGIVVVDGGLAYSADGRQVWIQEGPGAWQGIDIRYGGNNPTTPADMWDLVSGDQVEITGVVERFGAETQLNPLDNGVNVIGSGPVGYTQVPIGDLNDGGLTNQIVTGEQWEGQYIEITDVTVVSVSAPFGGNRQNFVIEDGSGNQMQVSDRFPAGRSTASTGNNNRNDDPGELVIPSTGTTFDTIRGLVFHTNPSGCAATGNLAFGYELHPFASSDLVIGASGPQISGVSRNPFIPNETQATTIQASIVDPDGNIASALLYYAVGLNSTNFTAVPMTDIGGIYQAVIPASAYNNDDYVEYYLTATDNNNLSSSFPPQGASQPVYFAVRADGPTIYDVQFTKANANGISPFQGQSVTVSGIVTASAESGDLGYVYIQQPGEALWAGLSLTQAGDLASLQRGDEVEVTGQIIENFGFTVMEVTALTTLALGQPLPDAVEVNPDDFVTANYDTEPYEGMLVKLVNPAGGDLYVVDDNADNNTGGTNNFAEYRIGTSVLSDANGCRILAGRQTGSAFSSLNVSYINDSSYLFNDGMVNVPVCIVTPGDTVTSVTGIMTYSFSNNKLLPRNNDDFESYSGANCPDTATVAIADAALGRLRAYPNPAHSRLSVDHELVQPRALRVELFDLVGRRILSRDVAAGALRSELDLSAFDQGLYLLRVSDARETLLTEKLMID